MKQFHEGRDFWFNELPLIDYYAAMKENEKLRLNLADAVASQADGKRFRLFTLYKD